MSHEEVVRRGYDEAAKRYDTQRDQLANARFLERFVVLLPEAGSVLDIGCGAGRPVDRYLVDHGYAVTGLDLSPKQIELAKENVPEAQYEVRSMLDLKPGEFAVDGVVSVYAIFHTPRERHEPLLRTIASFLGPGGALLVSMGASEWEGTESDFHGAEMFWSHFGPVDNRRLIEAAGFAVDLDEIDDSAGEKHQFVVARKV